MQELEQIRRTEGKANALYGPLVRITVYVRDSQGVYAYDLAVSVE